MTSTAAICNGRSTSILAVRTQRWAESALAGIPGSAAVERRLRRSMTDDDACPPVLRDLPPVLFLQKSRVRHLTPAEPKHPERDQRRPK